MGRRLPRRMWHTVAALVPLPLIALGYVAAVPGNPVAFQFELYLSGKGSDQPLTQRAKLAPERLPLLWDMDFMHGEPGADGAPRHVLCEINVSSVSPFPPSCIAPLVQALKSRLPR